jgi:hypothetical protein
MFRTMMLEPDRKMAASELLSICGEGRLLAAHLQEWSLNASTNRSSSTPACPTASNPQLLQPLRPRSLTLSRPQRPLSDYLS